MAGHDGFPNLQPLLDNMSSPGPSRRASPSKQTPKQSKRQQYLNLHASPLRRRPTTPNRCYTAVDPDGDTTASPQLSSEIQANQGSESDEDNRSPEKGLAMDNQATIAACIRSLPLDSDASVETINALKKGLLDITKLTDSVPRSQLSQLMTYTMIWMANCADKNGVEVPAVVLRTEPREGDGEDWIVPDTDDPSALLRAHGLAHIPRLVVEPMTALSHVDMRYIVDVEHDGTWATNTIKRFELDVLRKIGSVTIPFFQPIPLLESEEYERPQYFKPLQLDRQIRAFQKIYRIFDAGVEQLQSVLRGWDTSAPNTFEAVTMHQARHHEDPDTRAFHWLASMANRQQSDGYMTTVFGSVIGLAGHLKWLRITRKFTTSELPILNGKPVTTAVLDYIYGPSVKENLSVVDSGVRAYDPCYESAEEDGNSGKRSAGGKRSSTLATNVATRQGINRTTFVLVKYLGFISLFMLQPKGISSLSHEIGPRRLEYILSRFVEDDFFKPLLAALDGVGWYLAERLIRQEPLPDGFAQIQLTDVSMLSDIPGRFQEAGAELEFPTLQDALGVFEKRAEDLVLRHVRSLDATSGIDDK